MLEKITHLQLSKTLYFSILIILFAFPVIAQDKPELEIGGALRFNYNLSSWKEGQKKIETQCSSNFEFWFVLSYYRKCK